VTLGSAQVTLVGTPDALDAAACPAQAARSMQTAA
jgi:hypothetical protein